MLKVREKVNFGQVMIEKDLAKIGVVSADSKGVVSHLF
jgi:hypothetical protein